MDWIFNHKHHFLCIMHNRNSFSHKLFERMKPKTEIQKRVVSLSEKLPELSYDQITWAKENCFKKVAHKRKNSYLCLECGELFPIGKQRQYAKPKVVVCPHCDNLLKIEESKKRTSSESHYYSIYTVAEEFQVLRHFLVKKECKGGRESEVHFLEAVQNWISPEGEFFNISRSTVQSHYYDAWSSNSVLELRGYSNYPQKYEVYAKFIYPKQSFIPRLRRNGFKRGLHGISPYYLLPALLTKSKAETLMKAKQYSLLRSYCLSMSTAIERNWGSIKICLRNNYQVKDTAIWLDYIDLLEHFGKDIRNAKYVCPDDLMKEHDRLSDKRMKELQNEQEEDKKRKAAKDEKEFRDMKSKYFGIAFSDGLINVVVLDSVQEYIKDGELLHHCVFSNEYYKKDDSLILSARIDDAPIETVEISLDDYSVIQSRGLQNQNSKYHKQILELVNSNTHLFRKSNKSTQFVKQQMAEAI